MQAKGMAVAGGRPRRSSGREHELVRRVRACVNNS